MDQRQLRIRAVRQCLRGEPVSAICRTVGKSRRWLYYWLRRYSPTDKRWSHNRSRAPHHQARKIPQHIEHLVREVRGRLVQHKYAQRGAVAIQWELRQLGVDPLPPVWTINRIIRRLKLYAPRTRRRTRPAYPTLDSSAPGMVQQMDLVGPRYLAGGTRFYGLNLMDACSNAVALETITSKRNEAICHALLAQWHRLGVPHYLQLDNELSFRGSNRYPRSFSLLVRLCLHVGAEVVFIPEGEPWRNGVVERFNDTYDKMFFRRQRFTDLDHLRRELPVFERFHNEHHRYTKLNQRTPQSVHTRHKHSFPPRQLALATIRRTWQDGRIRFVRLTDQHGCVRFFTEQFPVDPTLVHEYVTGIISTRNGRLQFYHQGKRINTIKYRVSKNPIL
jgi:putative transposase